MVFHERKETSKTTSPPAKPKNTSNGEAKEYSQGQVQEINKKVDGKIQKVEENILQWIDEETKCLKDGLEKDISAIRSEVDEKNIELNSKVQATISNLKEEVNDKVALMDSKLTDTMFNNDDDLPLDESEPSKGTNRQIMDLKNRLHHNCNTLRFLCSEPLSVQFSIWSKKEIKVPLTGDSEVVPFNWVNCNSGGAVDDGRNRLLDFNCSDCSLSRRYLESLYRDQYGWNFIGVFFANSLQPGCFNWQLFQMGYRTSRPSTSRSRGPTSSAWAAAYSAVPGRFFSRGTTRRK